MLLMAASNHRRRIGGNDGHGRLTVAAIQCQIEIGLFHLGDHLRSIAHVHVDDDQWAAQARLIVSLLRATPARWFRLLLGARQAPRAMPTAAISSSAWQGSHAEVLVVRPNSPGCRSGSDGQGSRRECCVLAAAMQAPRQRLYFFRDVGVLAGGSFAGSTT